MKNKKLINLVTVTMVVFSAVPAQAAAKDAKLTDEKKQLIVQYNNYKNKFQKSINVVNENSVKKDYDANQKVDVIVQLKGKNVLDLEGQNSSGQVDAIAAQEDRYKLSKNIEKKQQAFKNKVSNIDSSTKIKRTFTYVMNGFSAEVKYKDISKIKKMAGVESVSVAQSYVPDLNYSKELTKVYDVWKNSNYKGQGMVISVIDSGIDPTHKDMRISDPSKAKIKNKNPKGPGKYYTSKVPYAYNFADNNDIVKDTTGEDHGMHVSGIIAANGTDEEVKAGKAVRGVAPEAQLLDMKVFSNDTDYASASTDNIVEAIDESVEHGADVINMSLGSPAGYVEPDEPENAAIANAQKHGVVVVCSAGNEQYSTAPSKLSSVIDTSVVGSPSTTKQALSVASYENSKLVYPVLEYSTDKESGKIPYLLSVNDPIGTLNGDYEIVDCGLGSVDDFADKDIKGKIALIQRGGNTFVEKKLNAQNAGAIATIVYNKDGDDTYISMQTDAKEVIPSMFVSNSDGKKLKAFLDSNEKIKFIKETVVKDNPTKGDMSDFSSWGPTPDLEFKPQVTAPGGNIYSTLNDNRYGTMSGTSMASPHTAGITALLLEHLKDMDLTSYSKYSKAELAKTILMNTSIPQMDPNTDKKLPFSPRRQGAGLVDAEAAVNTDVIVRNGDGLPSVALKELKSKKVSFQLTLTNMSKKNRVYSMKDLSGVMTEQGKDTTDMSYDVKANGAKVTFDKAKVTVAAGKTANVNVTITLSSKTKKNEFVEGYVQFVSHNGGQTLTVPYMGFYGDWSSLSIMDKPMWDENSDLGLTGVYNADTDEVMGVTGKDKDGNTVVNKDCIAASTKTGVKVEPKVALLRNAKNFKLDVLDKNKKVVRTLYVDYDLQKDLFASAGNDSGDDYSAASQWIWNLKVYNAKTGKNEYVKDGQYYFRFTANIDYIGAKKQTMDLPIKVDSAAPKVSITSSNVTDTNKYTLNFNAADDFSGLDVFNIKVNNKDYIDADGNAMIKLTPNSNGEYSVDLNLEDADNKIEVSAFDNAGNLVTKDITVSVPKVKITSLSDWQHLDIGDIKLAYEPNSEIASKVKKYNITLDGQSKAAGITDTSYTFKLLPPGKHEITVTALDADGKELSHDTVNFIVREKKLYVNFINVRREGTYYTKNNITVKGELNTDVKKFTIQGKDVTVNKDLTFSSDLTIKEGLNKVPVYVKDINGNEQKYALNLYGDMKKPVIKAPTKDIHVSREAKTYTVKITASDEYELPNVYINGDAIKGNANDRYLNKGEFKKIIVLKDKKTSVTIKVTDKAGNSIEKKFVIIKDKKN
ncbi:S8 family serine peptidase [Clostridium oryzae]|uniref:PIII-type proteinase n=1 Tax=Clostridium oryzae TaxID=1450648 RepID=A0A1V4IPI4_9CLOT|nr:S8 family serine peptidase [Clostridium oryzae]OPJ61922.1 PIII-type proteinase precursor [Clostridium oryzae]